ncbi:hypothetical protein Dimus_039697 [Dionaea muscipula]
MCTSMSSDNSKFIARNLVTTLDISMIYLRILPLLLYSIEVSLFSGVLASTFSFAVNRSASCLRNSLALFSSVMEPLMVSGMTLCIIIRLMRFDLSHFS